MVGRRSRPRGIAVSQLPHPPRAAAAGPGARSRSLQRSRRPASSATAARPGGSYGRRSLPGAGGSGSRPRSPARTARAGQAAGSRPAAAGIARRERASRHRRPARRTARTRRRPRPRPERGGEPAQLDLDARACAMRPAVHLAGQRQRLRETPGRRARRGGRGWRPGRAADTAGWPGTHRDGEQLSAQLGRLVPAAECQQRVGLAAAQAPGQEPQLALITEGHARGVVALRISEPLQAVAAVLQVDVAARLPQPGREGACRPGNGEFRPARGRTGHDQGEPAHQRGVAELAAEVCRAGDRGPRLVAVAVAPLSICDLA